jgi:hypothetical protein
MDPRRERLDVDRCDGLAGSFNQCRNVVLIAFAPHCVTAPQAKSQSSTNISRLRSARHFPWRYRFVAENKIIVLATVLFKNYLYPTIPGWELA